MYVFHNYACGMTINEWHYCQLTNASVFPRWGCLLLLPRTRNFAHIAPIDPTVLIGECVVTPAVMFP